MTACDPPPRLVLDTNVCLDLLLYRDAGCAALAADLADGRWQAVTRADCREEWLRVLRYPQFRVDATQYTALVQAFDALMAPWTVVHDGTTVLLPQCRDGDDQKFLELALESGATALLSKDKAVLKLARRTRRMGLFAILPPSAWSERGEPLRNR